MCDHDTVDATTLGSLSCRTSDHALITGNASARFSVKINMDLNTCVLGNEQIQILWTGGTFGGILETFKDSINFLEGGMADQLARLCQ